MKNLILVACIFMHFSVNAEEWFCTEESGKRDGNTIMACGVGEWTDEGEARKRALNAAIEEFGSICEISHDCAGKKRSVEPKRTSCTRSPDVKGFYKCYRLIVVTLLN